MTDLEMWNLIVGAAVPPLVAVVLKSAWPKAVKAAVAIATSVVIGVVSAAIAGDFEGKPLVTGMLLAAIGMKVAYEKFWKPLGISPTIETRVNIIP